MPQSSSHSKPCVVPSLPTANGQFSDRYELIDAWRGLAALAVVVHHVTSILIGGPAVMLFFVISGYCIAASADGCQRKGWGFKGFMWRRIRRIYPPYLLSLVYWSATRLAKWKLQHGPNELDRPLSDWLQNATLTQWLTLLQDPQPHAARNKTLFVSAYWSLCYEEQFYLLMGLLVLIAPLLRVKVLTLSAVLLVAGFAWNIIFPQKCFGVFIEYWALFAIGIIVFHRLSRICNVRVRWLIDGGLLALFGISTFIRWFSGIAWVGVESASGDVRVVYEELAIASGFALLLILMRPASETIAKGQAFRPLVALGNITFSLYLIHQCNLMLMQTIAFKIMHFLTRLPMPSPEQPWPWYFMWTFWFLQIAGHVGIASIFWYFCERPFLNKPIVGPKDGAPPLLPTC